VVVVTTGESDTSETVYVVVIPDTFNINLSPTNNEVVSSNAISASLLYSESDLIEYESVRRITSPLELHHHLNYV
jgi:hypothetical protein